MRFLERCATSNYEQQVQTLKESNQRIRRVRANRKKNRSYSPFLAFDFYLLGPLKAALPGGLSSDDGDDLKHSTRADFGSFRKELYATSIQLPRRGRKSVSSVREFIEK